MQVTSDSDHASVNVKKGDLRKRQKKGGQRSIFRRQVKADTMMAECEKNGEFLGQITCGTEKKGQGLKLTAELRKFKKQIEGWGITVPLEITEAPPGSARDG